MRLIFNGKWHLLVALACNWMTIECKTESHLVNCGGLKRFELSYGQHLRINAICNVFKLSFEWEMFNTVLWDVMRFETKAKDTKKKCWTLSRIKSFNDWSFREDVALNIFWIHFTTKIIDSLHSSNWYGSESVSFSIHYLPTHFR